eukprot:gene15491-18399_t
MPELVRFRVEGARNSLPVLKEYRGLEIKCLKNYIVDMDFFAYKDSMHIYEESTVNESELNALMTKRGFNVVFLEELSFYEKIALFKSADIIIGDFSSGWGHIVFIKK